MRNPKFKFAFEKKISKGNEIITILKELLSRNRTYTIGEYFFNNRIEIYLGSIKKITEHHKNNKIYHNRLKKVILEIIPHEYLHFVFKDMGIDITTEQGHWATEKLGFGGEML